MDVNQGRFLVNGKSGYVLKPAFMRDPGTEFDPITLTRGDWLQHKTLHLMVESCSLPPTPAHPPFQMYGCCNGLLSSSGHISAAAPQSERQEVLHRGPAG